MVQDALAAGNAALAEGRWAVARSQFEQALLVEESAAALRGLGHALWWLGEIRPGVGYDERAYAAFRRQGDVVGAVGTAVWLSITYWSSFGSQAASRGWAARAARLLDGTDVGPLHGWVDVARAYYQEDPSQSIVMAERALAVAREHGDTDLELCALGELGDALVASGRIDEGLVLVDEAMAGSLGGEHTSLDTVVFTSCQMLIACDLAADVSRAAQWCRVADDFIERYGCPYLYVDCRMRYGSVLVATGQWTQAENELQDALRASADAHPAMYAQALARLAGLRMRQGRLEEAQALLSTVDDQPAVALETAMARHRRGEHAAAQLQIERHLAAPSGPYRDIAQVLELLVDVHIALGDTASANAVSGRLAAMAQPDGGRLAAYAAATAGRVAFAGGDVDLARHQLGRALHLFADNDLPYESARARLALAEALAHDLPEAAAAEAQVAFRAFEQLGAATDGDAAAALLRSLGARARTGPKGVGKLTERERQVLELVADGMSNPEIARRLFISPKTASHHVSALLRKLGLRNRAEAAAYGARSATLATTDRWYP